MCCAMRSGGQREVICDVWAVGSGSEVEEGRRSGRSGRRKGKEEAGGGRKEEGKADLLTPRNRSGHRIDSAV